MDMPCEVIREACAVLKASNCRLFLFKYQRQIISETTVAKGGANPIQNNDVGSMRLKIHDNGIRNKNVAIRLCNMGNHELPCPLK